MTKLNLFRKLPDTFFYIAYSGGVDSSVLLDLALKQKKNFGLAFFDHRDSFAQVELDNLRRVRAENPGMEIQLAEMIGDAKSNKENQWRLERYHFFHSLGYPVLTGHHLNDCAEWYLMTCMRGRGEWMRYQGPGQVFRPLLNVSKAKILEYANVNRIRYLADPANTVGGLRAKVRNQMMPVVLDVEPGFLGMCKRKIEEVNK